jgi:hypothetical protein
MADSRPKFMPVLATATRGPGFPDLKLIPFAALHEGSALRVHDQTLDRLAERGGLDWCELWGNMMRVNILNVTVPAERDCAWFVAGFVIARSLSES